MNKDHRLSSAIHILAGLEFSGKINSKVFALSLKTNPALIRRLLAQLSRAKLVVCEKGKGGGSRLARSPGKITIKHIYLALGKDHIFGSFDKQPYKKCPVSCSIKTALDFLYQEIESAMLRKMDRITLEDVIKTMKLKT